MTVWDYVNQLADVSKSEQHEVIEECLAYFGLMGTRELTLEQTAVYWELVRPR